MPPEQKPAPEKFRRRRLFPRTLGECAAPLMKPALEKHGAVQAQILRDWPSIIGEEISRNVTPRGISWPKGKNAEGTLTLLVAGGLATEVQHMEPYILEKLAAYFGYRAVSRLRIQQVSRRPDEAKPRPSPTTAAPAPLPVTVEDDMVRASLERLALALATKRE